ncbi:unnamed protein product [Rhodiola kirilowii]
MAGSTASGTTGGSNASSHPSDDPLFVGTNENLGVSLVTEQLTGAMDYIPWEKAMEMALSGKMKLGFVQGNFPHPTDALQKARWIKCISVIHSWLINSVSKEIACSLVHSVDCIQAWQELQMQFGDMSVASYFGKLRKLWGDKESLDDGELCTLGAALV